MANMNQILAISIAALVIVVIFSLAPMVGDTVDGIDSTPDDDYATGTFTLTANVSSGEFVNITAAGVTHCFEFNTTGTGVTNDDCTNVPVSIDDNTSALAGANLTTIINANDTISDLVTLSNSGAVTTITADATGEDANSYATTDTVTGGFAAAVLSGGDTATDWSPDSTTALETPAETWATFQGLVVLAVLAVIIGIIIAGFKQFGGRD